jgi:hypothetical protein
MLMWWRMLMGTMKLVMTVRTKMGTMRLRILRAPRMKVNTAVLTLALTMAMMMMMTMETSQTTVTVNRIVWTTPHLQIAKAMDVLGVRRLKVMLSTLEVT